MDLYVAAGVPVAKLGLGTGIYGLYCSEPVTGPDQALQGASILAGDSVMSLANIMELYIEWELNEGDWAGAEPGASNPLLLAIWEHVLE